jgi:hypothetical protein
MRHIRIVGAFMALFALAGVVGVFAGSTANQTVTYQVTGIYELAASGNPGALIVSTATAGDPPNAVSDASTTYAITTNDTNMKITGKIDTAMPGGLTLTLTLAATGGGTSTAKNLTATAQDLETGISTVADPAKTITYSLSATVAAGIVPSGTKTVTLTLTAG